MRTLTVIAPIYNEEEVIRDFYRELKKELAASDMSLRKLFELEEYRVMSQRTHNFPLKALDVPEGNKFLALIYRAGIACVFSLTSRFGGVHQTIVCQKH